jgi:hypothetical protein
MYNTVHILAPLCSLPPSPPSTPAIASHPNFPFCQVGLINLFNPIKMVEEISRYTPSLLFLFSPTTDRKEIVLLSFFGSGSGSYFSVFFCSRSYLNFSSILDIYFTFVFPSSKCVRLHIMTRYRYKLFREIFFYIKMNYIIN